jgi:hypothetical protein
VFGKFKGANLERAYAAPADFGGSEVPRVSAELASSPVNAREFNERLLLA